MFTILLAKAEFLVSESDQSILAQVLIPLQIPQGTEPIAGLPAEGEIAPEDRQARPRNLTLWPQANQVLNRVQTLAAALTFPPSLLVPAGQANCGGRRRVLPRPPRGGHVHPRDSHSHSDSIRRRRSSSTRCTVRSLIPSRSPMSLLESPSAFS